MCLLKGKGEVCVAECEKKGSRLIVITKKIDSYNRLVFFNCSIPGVSNCVQPRGVTKGKALVYCVC